MDSCINESVRRLPVAGNVDLAVIGGSTAAVAAAAAAARHGARVMVLVPRTYLGEDLCATLRLGLASGDRPDHDLTERLFPQGAETTPLHVKKTLDSELLAAEVKVLFGCYATEALHDARGMLCGCAIANRAGRQAVLAKVVVDATDRAWFARLAGAATEAWPGGIQAFSRMVIVDGGAVNGLAVERVIKLNVPDAGFASLAEAEQNAREVTCTRGQLRAAESLFLVPPDPIVCRRRAADRGAERDPDPGHFRPAALDRLYVLGGCADLPRTERERLLQPCGLLPMAAKIGVAAAVEARGLTAPVGVQVAGTAGGEDAGEVRERLAGLRLTGEDGASVVSPSRNIPVWAAVDVVVVGGGTAGAAAAIGAARQGSRVLLVEYQEGPGGLGTVGLLGKPYHGLKMGFSAEVPFPARDGCTLDDKMEWLRREIRSSGGTLWCGVLGCGALVRAGQVCGVIVATPEGRGVVRAAVVIDATGNADIAAAAGAQTAFGAEESGCIALQGTGLPLRPLRSPLQNSDYLLVDESDPVDASAALLGSRLAMPDAAFDCGPQIQSRERCRVVGEHILRYVDQIAGRTYPDTVVVAESDCDAHGYPVDDYFALMPHDAESLKANHPAPGGTSFVPYRCLLPRGLNGILVAGTAISMERDASALIRMQLDILNQGYAAGLAASMAAANGGDTRGVDIRGLQRQLCAKGNLPAGILEHVDSFPYPPEWVALSIRELAGADRLAAARALAVVMAHREMAVDPVRAAHAQATGEARLTYAKLLGFWGDETVGAELAEALDRVEAWDPKIFQGKMAEYAHLPTPADALVLALGRTRHPRALPVVLRVAEWLDATTPLSHHRAVALALEGLRQAAAAAPLARLLTKPGMSGHVMGSIEPLPMKEVGLRRREGALREIILARALYRCGDHERTGERILQGYQNDVRALFARHAAAVLAAGRNDDKGR
jgi:hypothetical protein